MKQKLNFLKKIRPHHSRRFIKTMASFSFLILSSGTFTYASSSSSKKVTPTCRLYFIQTDALQKFTPTEYRTLLIFVQKLTLLLGKTDSTSQDAKNALNQQLKNLITRKNFTSEEHAQFNMFFKNLITQHQQQTGTIARPKTLEDRLYQLRSILKIYNTQNIDEAFIFSAIKAARTHGLTNAYEMQVLLDAGADINYLDHSKIKDIAKTALMLAAENNNTDLLQFLITAKADVERSDTMGRTALMLAAESNSLEAIKILLNEKKVHIENEDDGRQTAIDYAIIHDHYQAVELLIEQGVPFNPFGKSSSSPLLKAIRFAALKSFEVLIRNNVNVNFQDPKNQTPLMYIFGVLNVISNLPSPPINDLLIMTKRLIQQGAKLDMQNERGDTALMHACKFIKPGMYEKNELIRVLIAAKANLNIKAETGGTALHYAVANENLEAVQLLIAAKADLNIQNRDDNTPLHLMMIGPASPIKEDIVRRLIQAGANLNLRNRSGSTPAMLAVKNSKVDLLKILIEAKADINIKDNLLNTPLIQATQYNDELLTQILVDAKADLDLRDGKKFTALMYASQGGQRPLVQILLAAKANPYIKNVQRGSTFGKPQKTALKLAKDKETSQLIEEYQKSLSWTDFFKFIWARYFK